MRGYHGRYLRIDLSARRAEEVALADATLQQWIGGVGLGTWICREEGGARCDALSPRAPLVFALSPLVGTPLTTSAKFAVVARSPLTGFLSDAISSSHFAIAAKRAGYDAIAVAGRAEGWTRVVVDDGAVRFEDAEGAWGRAAAECGIDGHRTAAIGPAGEALCLFATISNDGRHAGRGGLGAVMGSKRLKAISVRGTKQVAVADPRGVVEEARRLSALSFGPATAKYRELGTVANLLAFNRLNMLPTRNFAEGSFGGAEALDGMKRKARESCAACTIGCEHIFEMPSGEGVRLEYETLFALGPGLGIDDRGFVLSAAALCDRLGIDTISAGGTIACAMEAGFGGLRFGDTAGVLRALESMAEGGPLSRGSKRLAESIGRPEIAMHVKGLEIPGYDARRLPAMALGFAVGTRGADHNRSSAYELDFSTEAFDVGRIIEIENRAAAMDSLILCKFLRGVFADFGREGARLVELVAGFSPDLAAAGSAICRLRRRFNAECGWTPADDTLPGRLLGGAMTRERLTALVAQYHAVRHGAG